MDRVHIKPEYETGMKVLYDPHSKRAAAFFRGRHIALPTAHEDEATAVAAGERLCRGLGWIPAQGKAKSSLLRRAAPRGF
ncbi:MAG: hypothetical protein ACYCZX_08130 [Rhodospirillaceae bacterium]